MLVIRIIFAIVIILNIQVIFSQEKEIRQTKTNKELNYFEIKSYYDKILPRDENGKIIKNKWIQRWLWNNKNNITPDGRFKQFPKYFEFDKNYENKLDDIQSQSGWQPLGPEQLTKTYEPRSCQSNGRINCVAFHPTNPEIFWIGTPGGGIWKTIDAGKNWMPLDDQLPSLAVSDIAVDPKNPDVIYVTTGDIDAGGISNWNSLGILKTTDGGLSWKITSLRNDPEFNSYLMRRVIINPVNTNELIAAGLAGIWTSDDAGETWKFIERRFVTDIEIDPVNPQIVYAATGTLYNYYGSAGIIKSTDFGENWTELNTGIIPTGKVSRVDIAVSPADPNYIYAVTVFSDYSNYSRINGLNTFYLSTDAGETWEIKANYQNSPNIFGAYSGNFTDGGGQGTYDLAMVADPIDKNKVYFGGVNVWMTEDAGENWEIAGFWIYCFGESIHADHHFAAYNPLDKYLYFCNDGGIYRTKSIEPGSKDWITDWVDKKTENVKPGAPEYKFPTQWENLTGGLAITEFYRLGLSKNNSGYVTGGSQDNSCFYYDKNEWINYIANYDGMETMIDHDNPEIIYGVWQGGGLCKSTDGGKTITTGLADTIKNVIREAGSWITPVTMNPLHSDTIYIGFRNLWRSGDGCENWDKVFDFDSLQNAEYYQNSITILKNSYANPDYICFYKEYHWEYLQEEDTVISVPAQFWITNDGCRTWYEAGKGLPTDSINIVDIEYDLKNPNKFWVITSGWEPGINLYLTEDGGNTWQNISKLLPIGINLNCIEHRTDENNQYFYAGTNKGVYYTDNTLNEWKPFNKNLPNTIVRDLEIDLATNELYAATYGRGIWKTDILSGIEKIDGNNFEFVISPYPAKESFVININQNNISNSEAEINILDITGKIISKYEFSITSNNFKKEINSKLPNGIYFVSLQMNGRNYVEKVVINR